MTFESFMRKHGVPRSTTTADRPSFGWLDNAPEGDAFVGSHGRVFDVIVMSRSAPLHLRCRFCKKQIGLRC